MSTQHTPPDMAVELASLRRERDELREALRMLVDSLARLSDSDCIKGMNKARALLTRKGEQNT